MDEKIVEILKQIKSFYGENIFETKNRFNSILYDYAKDSYKGEINLLNTTLTLGLYKEIKASPADYSKIRSRYIAKMRTEYFWTEELAVFAVDCWGVVAGVINELVMPVRVREAYKGARNYESNNTERTISIIKRGNTTGNSLNSGYVAIQGDWIYYKNLSFSGYLYKIHTNGAEKYRLNEDVSEEINVLDDWVYYKNTSDNNEIFRISLDGRRKMKLTDDSCFHINVIGNWIYYCRYGDYRLFKIRIDGTGKTRLNDDISFSVNVEEGWIYYRNSSDNDRLYKIRTDGTGKVKLSDDKIMTINANNDWIFYVNRSDHNKLYKIKTDGSLKKCLNDDFCFEINIIGDWIYYVNFQGVKLYKVRTDGTGRQLVD